MNKHQQLLDILMNSKPDFEKFEKGNHAAGTRVRKAMQDLKEKAQEVRVDVQEVKAKSE